MKTEITEHARSKKEVANLYKSAYFFLTIYNGIVVML